MSDSNTAKELHTDAQERPCPWYLCFTFDNIFRRLFQNPERILKPYVKPGYTVLDVGPGMGYFTIPMAKMVGDKGKVVAADLQKQMLEGIARRARRAGIQGRIQLHQTGADKIGVTEPIDFCLAFWMVHEVPDRARFLNEIAGLLKTDGQFLIVEPRLHVAGIDFKRTLDLAGRAGLKAVGSPRVFMSYTVLLKKTSQ